MKTLYSQPYLLLFPLGVFHALWGLSLWIWFGFFSGPYPVLHHAQSMSEGFLISFACGFLMTALPRFTQSYSAQKAETLSMFVLCLLAGFNDFAALSALLLLILFAGRRLKLKKIKVLPPFLFYILYGMLCGILGIAFKITEFPMTDTYKPFLFEGMILFWIMGIGSRILPMLLRLETQPSQLSGKLLPWIAHILFITFILGSFPPLQPYARALRVCLIGAACILYWNLNHFPKRKGYLAYGVWFSLFSIFTGNVILFVQPAWTLHALHIVMIMGYCLLIMMVASRVSLSHGGEGIRVEQTSKKILSVTVLVLLAGLTRFSAYFMPALYLNHLTYAASVLIVAFCVWLFLLVPVWKKTILDGASEVHP